MSKENRTRIYEIRVANSPICRLVEAVSDAQALRHVAKQHYEASLPTTKRVAYLCSQGVTVEDATKLPAAAIEEAAQAGVRG